MTVTGSLAALLEQLPARSVRLVVFNLEQQKELYRNDGFTVRELEQLTRVLDGLQLAMVDYRVLQQPQGQAQMLRALMQREAHEASRSDAMIFLGPDGSYAGSESTGEADAILPGQRIVFVLGTTKKRPKLRSADIRLARQLLTEAVAMQERLHVVQIH